MRGVLSRSFAAQLSALESMILTNHRVSPESGFVHYVMDQSPAGQRLNLPEISSLRLVAQGEAPEIAATAYLLVTSCRSLVDTMMEPWQASFERLRSKDPLPADRQSFSFRPYELLGISLGAARLGAGHSAGKEWVVKLLPNLDRMLHGNKAKWLLAAAREALSVATPAALDVRIDDLSLDEMALLLWLSQSKDFGEAEPWSSIPQKALQKNILERAVISDLQPQDSGQAALLYVALKGAIQAIVESEIEESWQITRAQIDALQLVMHMCQRFHGAARQLRHRHGGRSTLDIKDEYDVQDLLHVLLTFFFDDVRPEEWTPSYAGSASRTDFLLPREKLVIETKMTRKGLDQKRLADELIIDKERYKADHRCETLVCLVYDPDEICKNPAALENDLAQETGPRVRVVVVPRNS